jgi:hypothetical protein
MRYPRNLVQNSFCGLLRDGVAAEPDAIPGRIRAATEISTTCGESIGSGRVGISLLEIAEEPALGPLPCLPT